MDIEYKEGTLKIHNLSSFSLAQCLCCGQAFRWKPCGSGFSGVALGRAIYAEQCGDTLCLKGVDETAVKHLIIYFDLERDYDALKTQYADDPFLREGILYAQGLRVLRQPPFETLITFIISANNNVSRITKIIDALCTRFGAPLTGGFDFPEPRVLA